MTRLAMVLAAAMVLSLSLFGGARADAPRRVALVVANGDYVHAGSLKNPVNDARLVAASLKSAGFQIVDANPNLGIGPFRDALRRFRANAAGAQVALVYYAGHGIEARGKNWLIPVDAVLQQDADLEYEAIDLDLVLDATDGADMRVVVLDACRNNPFGHAWKHSTRAAAEGLAPVDVDDVLVIYSAGPGQTAMDGRGANSPFAEALAKRLPQPGVPIQMLGGLVRDDVLRATGEKQRPYISASITGTPFMLVPGAGMQAASQQAAPMDPKAIETVFWQSAQASNDIGQLKAYLNRYPSGMFVDLAKAKIASLQARPPALPPGAERTLGQVGKVDPKAVELAFWNSVSASNDIGQLTAYIDQYPSGTFVKAAKAKIFALTRPAALDRPAAKSSGTAVASRQAGSNGGVGDTVMAPPMAMSRPAQGRMGASDDYVCNHGDPGDPRTVEACQRLRGNPADQPS